MIISYLSGGIGNQLFQFAMGLSMAKRKNIELLFDVNSFRWDNLREFELQKLGIDYNIASDELIFKIKNTPSNFISKIKKRLNIEIPYYQQSYIKEQDFEYDLNFQKFNSNNVYFEGYWQSENYFRDIRGSILKSITFDNLSNECLEFKNNISKSLNSVSLHIRRGDYAQNPETNEYHGLMGINYYKSSIEILNSKLNNPTFFVFSDDKSYAKSLFDGKENFIVIDSKFEDYEELFLMSKCEHQIIANSSFSWWGAWLNQNKNKNVIAPKNWFKNQEMQSKTKDLIPKEWMRI
jgi:hypothetical protein